MTFDINACNDEIKDCKWLDINKQFNNNLTKKVAKLLKYGKKNGYDKIDIVSKQMQSPFAGRTYNFFHSKVNLDEL